MTSLPSTQKVIWFQKCGGPEVIEENLNAPVPQPAAAEVLIKVEWSGLNFIDTYFRSGLYPVGLPLISGCEGAGAIVAVGSNVKDLAVGDKVAAYMSGSLAEYATAPANKTTKLPPGVDTRDASTILLQGLSALTFATESYAVQKNDWILVHAAAGGLGLLFCQLASSLGATVIGTTSTEAKGELAKANGAHHIVLYGEGRPPVHEAVLQLTNGLGVHAIFDGVGKDTWEDNFSSIRRKGTIVSCGNASGPAPPFLPVKLGPKNIKLCRPKVNVYIETDEEWKFYTEKLWQLHEAGKIKITRHSDDGYPFTAQGVQKAHSDLAGRKTTGKLVVKIQ